MPDAAFEDPRLAAVYDPLDPDRSDLDLYLAIVEELRASSVLDVGCGTGTFACLLADRGLEVIAVDPAAASLEVAAAKPHGGVVRWIQVDATRLPPLQVGVATMTANVAQVFVTDEDWVATLKGIHGALAPRGHLVFETRVPERRAWEEWDREHTWHRTDVPGIGTVETWCDLGKVEDDLVRFRHTYVFDDGAALVSDSTLRFRTREQVEESLARTGFEVVEVRDAPDRPGREYVFIARRTD